MTRSAQRRFYVFDNMSDEAAQAVIEGRDHVTVYDIVNDWVNEAFYAFVAGVPGSTQRGLLDLINNPDVKIVEKTRPIGFPSGEMLVKDGSFVIKIEQPKPLPPFVSLKNEETQTARSWGDHRKQLMNRLPKHRR